MSPLFRKVFRFIQNEFFLQGSAKNSMETAQNNEVM